MDADIGAGQPGNGTPEASGCVHEQMWHQLRVSLGKIIGHLEAFTTADMRESHKVAAQVHGAELYNAKGVLGYMDLLEVLADAGRLAPDPESGLI